MLIFLLTAPAGAQEIVTGGAVPDGLNGQVFRPSIDSERTLWTNDTLLAPDKYSMGRFMLSYVNDPLTYTDGAGTRTELVSDLLQLNLLGGHTRGPVRFGLDVPLYLRSAGDATGGETGLGDITAGLRYTAIDRRTAPIGAALAFNATLPTATVDAPLGINGLGWEIEGIVDKEIGNVLLAANLGHRGQNEVLMENVEWDDQFFSRLGVGYALSDDGGLSADFSSNLTYAGLGDGGTPLELIGGGYRRVNDNLMLRGGIGTGLNGALGAPKLRVLVALAFEPPRDILDTDLDGLLDNVDSCPKQPEDIDGVQDGDGCPEPTVVTVVVKSSDGTALSAATWVLGDESGKSGGQGEMFGGEYDLTVQAEGFASTGSTWQIPDAETHQIEVTLEQLVGMGSLLVRAIDQDGNPVAAKWQARGTELRGVEVGSEMDIAAGEYNLIVTADGYLPVRETTMVVQDTVAEVVVTLEPAKATVVGERIDIKESVYFETNKDIIKSASHKLLNDIAEILIAHSELTGIRIEGHTDDRGSAEHNKDLSQRRAEAVRRYLIERGVEAERLQAVGYGEEKPVVSGNNASAWSQNRRVDFFVSARNDE
jgi:outer membrane protein OmpA-like peptidoglycan-associated protein